MNDLLNVMDKLLARGLLALRKNAVTPQLVNRAYETTPGTQGSSIEVPVPSSVAVTDVTPAATPPTTPDQTPTVVSIPLNRWKEAKFHLSDKDLTEISGRAEYIPMMAAEAIKVLADELDAFVLGLGAKFYGAYGTAGTTPFASTVVGATQIRNVLNKQLAPLSDRRLMLNPDAEAAALAVAGFTDKSFTGSPDTPVVSGLIAQRFGMDWYMNQNIQSHTAGTGQNYLVNQTSPGLLAGTKTIPVDTGTGTLVVGDIVSFANHTQTYVVTSALSGGSFAIEPGLVSAVPNNTAVTGPADTGGVGNHVMNLAFHRDAIALVTKPLAGSNIPGVLTRSMADPISGLVLRLEVQREYRRDRYAFDILYGAEVIRRELGARLLG